MIRPYTYGLADSYFLSTTGESAASSSGSPAKSSVQSDTSTRSSGSSSSSTSASSPAPEPVQTQPCSLKGSLSSDNIYAALHGDGMTANTGPGQGTHTLAQPLQLVLYAYCTYIYEYQDCKTTLERHFKNIYCLYSSIIYTR